MRPRTAVDNYGAVRSTHAHELKQLETEWYVNTCAHVLQQNDSNGAVWFLHIVGTRFLV